MSVNVIRINGVALPSQNLLERIETELEATKAKLNELSREARRSKIFKKVMTILAFTSTIGIACVTKAHAMDSSLAVANMNSPSIGGWVADKIFKHFVPDGVVSVDKNDSVAWMLSKYMTDSLFKTQDMFSNLSIIHSFNTIWMIVLSFTTLIIGKKGMDMAKAKALGTTSTGASEFIIRLLASVVMTFFSLDIMSIGVKLSNLITKTLMSNMGKGIMTFDNFLQMSELFTGGIFWIIGFIVMFVILGLRYWTRQINLLILGVITPVTNMAWVTDGGAMLGTLIKEVVVHLTTPIAQALTLALGTTVLFEVSSHVTAHSFTGFINAMLIGLSTCFLMIVTPDFLRKFIHGSANPFSAAAKLFLGVKAMPSKLIGMMK